MDASPTRVTAFPAPEGYIEEIEQLRVMRGLSLSECFRKVLTKWMDVCSPTAGDLYSVLNAQSLGGQAERCFQEYARYKLADFV